MITVKVTMSAIKYCYKDKYKKMATSQEGASSENIGKRELNVKIKKPNLHSCIFYLGCILDNGKFIINNYDAYSDTYQAAEQTIREMRELEDIHSFTAPSSKYEYLYNSKCKKAILLKSISRKSQSRFG